MILFYLGQVPAQWFTEAGDAALSGGVLRFFEVGTSSPKAVYSDYQGVTAAGTSVALDSSGRANVFLDGLYSVTLEDSNGVQIGPKVDGIGDGSALGISSISAVTNYDAVRALTGSDARAVTAQGLASSGDGGAGLFVWDDIATDPDDGGTILKPTSNPVSGRWRRVFSETIDPRWYGVVLDGTTANDATFAVAVAASVTTKARLHFEGGFCRLTSNYTIPAHARLSAGMRGGITATITPVALTFAAGSRFELGSPECFAAQLQPLFEAGTIDEIPLSWMGAANAEARLDKWAAADDGAARLTLDVSLSSSSLPTFASTSRLYPRGGIITVSGLAQDFEVELEHDGFDQVIAWYDLSAVGTVNVGNRPCRPEWFGAVGDGTADDHIPLYAAMLTGRVEMAKKDARYAVASDLSVGAIDISGVLRNALTVPTISATKSTIPSPCILMADGKKIDTNDGACSLSGVGFYAKESGGGIDCGSGNFGAFGCVLVCYNMAAIGTSGVGDVVDSYVNSALIFPAGTRSYSNVRTNSEAARRSFGEVSEFEGVYITDCANDGTTYDSVLTTDRDGLVSDKHVLTLAGVVVDSITPSVAGIKRVNSDYTVLDSDPQFLIVDPDAAPVTITLPKEAGATLQVRYIVCAYANDSNNVVISGDVFTTGYIPQLSSPQIFALKTVAICIYDATSKKWAWG